MPPRLRRRNVAWVVLLAVVVFDAAVLLALKAVFPALQLWPHGRAAPRPPRPAVAAEPVVALSGQLPAQAVVAKVLAAEPTTLPGGGWQPVTPPDGAAGTPYDYACGRADGPAPVVSQVRGWAQTSGPLPSDLQAALSVSMRAYAAGQGAVAFNAMRARLDACPKAGASSSRGPGVQAMAAYSTDTASLVWRRGDVLGMISYRTGSSAGSLSTIGPLAGEYDNLLTQALTGVCAETDSSAADAARSPYVDPSHFTGLTVAQPVPVPAPTVAPTPEPPFPQPSLPVPTVAPLPSRPADPVTPSRPPSPVSTPVVPVAPTPAPTQTDVPQRIADPAGPGCGWAFTGQQAPPYDPGKAQADLAAARAAAERKLVEQRAQFDAARGDYQVRYQAYVRQVQAFTAYAQQAERTRVAWTAIQAARDAYYAALATYDAAVAARNSFPVRQQAAAADYAAAVQACAVAPPVPAPVAPTPSPTVAPVTPGAPGSGTPGGPGAPGVPTPGASPTDSAASTGPVAFAATAPAGCPPQRPAILSQSPPPLPPKPVPPPGLPR